MEHPADNEDADSLSIVPANTEVKVFAPELARRRTGTPVVVHAQFGLQEEAAPELVGEFDAGRKIRRSRAIVTTLPEIAKIAFQTPVFRQGVDVIEAEILAGDTGAEPDCGNQDR